MCFASKMVPTAKAMEISLLKASPRKPLMVKPKKSNGRP